MDFLVFVILFGLVFTIIVNLLEWALPIVYGKPLSDITQCEGMHQWHYNDKGYLQCTVCKYKALDND